MLLQRCEKNHFYDKDKFAGCPYCALEKCGQEEETNPVSTNSLEDTEESMYGDLHSRNGQEDKEKWK